MCFRSEFPHFAAGVCGLSTTKKADRQKISHMCAGEKTTEAQRWPGGEVTKIPPPFGTFTLLTWDQ